MARAVPPSADDRIAALSMGPRDTLEDIASDGAPLAFAGAALERARVFSSLHARMFGTAAAVTVGRFRLLERIGAGAMGVVYAAHDPELDRKVALKVLHGAASDPDRAARIEREARALARLRHPNVVTVHEVGTHAGARFIAMDLVDGVRLSEWMATVPPWRRVVDVFVEAARGLAAAHDAGLVHRDFKPDNVLVERGHAKVVDFGFARSPATMPTLSDHPTEGAVDTITRPGAIAGTPAYMAPEALRGEIDARSDQFAFCASLYEALFGVRPFTGPTIPALLEAIEGGRPTTATIHRRVPRWLRRAMMRGLAAQPGARWPSMHAWVREVERRRGRSRYTAIIAAVGGASIGALLVFASSGRGSGPCDAITGAEGALWDEARREAIGTAFAATGLAHAEDGWLRAEATMGAWADAWTTMRRDACEATHVRHEQSERLLDERMQCLDRHREAFDALAEAFALADESIVTHAVAASHALAPLQDCADTGRLARSDDRAPGDPPPDRMHARLAVARAGLATGGYAAALPDAAELAGAAADAGYPVLAAEAFTVVAELQQRAADLDAAEDSALQAIGLAERAGDDALRVAAQIVLVSILAERRAVERGQDWAGLTDASLGRLDDPPRLRAQLAMGVGNLRHAAGRYEDALASRRESLALREGFAAEGDPQLADSHFGIGVALHELGRHDEARGELEQALALRRRVLGEHHPMVARTHNAVGNVLMSQGRFDDAIAHLRQAIDLGTLALGAEHPFVGQVYANLGNAVAQGRDPQASEPHFLQAIAVFEAAAEPDAVSIATALLNLGRVLAFTGRAEEAVPILRRVADTYETELGPTHADNLYVYANLAAALRMLGRSDAALEAAVRSREIGEMAFGGEHAVVADAWRIIGEIEAERGDPAAARVALEAALRIHERIESRPPERAVVHLALAQVHVDAGAVADAREHIARARAGFGAEPNHDEWLAELDTLEARLP